MAKSLKRSRNSDRKIVLNIGTMWTKTQISILAFFIKNENQPSTYREITRAYTSSSYSSYQKACADLIKGGWIKKREDGKFNVSERSWPQVKTGKFDIETEFPFLKTYLKKVKKIRIFTK